MITFVKIFERELTESPWDGFWGKQIASYLFWQFLVKLRWTYLLIIDIEICCSHIK